MKRLGFIAFSLSLFCLAACAVSEPGPKKPADIGDDDAIANPTDAKDNPSVVMETSMGTVKMLLYQDKAPITVANFLRYVDKKHYDGTIFHRVIEDFMIQGGGMEPNMFEKPSGAPIKNESYNGLTNDRGTLAMARTPAPHSATAQFFINVKKNGFLNRSESDDGFGYTVFGRVTDGMAVVDEIRRVPTRKPGDVPVQTVMIKSIRRIETKKE